MNHKYPADSVFLNGTVITMNGRNEIAEAVAIDGDTIQAIGNTKEIEKFIGPDTEVSDLNGKALTPGFIDSHCHPSTGGPRSLYEVSVHDAESIDDIIEMIESRARELPAGSWILARRYDDRRLREKRHPNRWDLDRAAPGHPVYLMRVDACLSTVNSQALQLAGITRDTPNPKGGIIDRDPDTGEPTGVLREVAQKSIRSIIPKYSIEQIKEGILAVCRDFAHFGVTSFTDADVDKEGLIAYQELVAENKMPLRAGILIPFFPMFEHKGYESEIRNLGLKNGFGNSRLKIVGAKLSSDGSMSGWTAALHEPYSNEAGNCGVMKLSRDNLIAGIVGAHTAGLRPCIHAIGDRAIDMVLDAIEIALQEKPDNDSRIRIEKCTLPTPEALQRIRKMGVIPSSLTGFIYELGSAHLEGIGHDRIKRYIPHKSYIDMGIISSGGSDWSVTSPNVLQQIYGATTRKSYKGEVIGGNQAISVIDALRLYTINGAYASFEENIKGSLEPGKLADLAILNKNILTVDPEEILGMHVEATIVGGKTVYHRDGSV